MPTFGFLVPRQPAGDLRDHRLSAASRGIRVFRVPDIAARVYSDMVSGELCREVGRLSWDVATGELRVSVYDGATASDRVCLLDCAIRALNVSDFYGANWNTCTTAGSGRKQMAFVARPLSSYEDELAAVVGLSVPLTVESILTAAPAADRHTTSIKEIAA